MKRAFLSSLMFMRSRLIRIAYLSVALSACGGGGGGTTNPPPVTQKLGSITVQPSTLSLDAGRASVLSVTALDEVGVAILGTAGFSFASTATTVAEVSATGSVLGISAGTATINVSLTLAGVTKTAAAAVTVSGTLPASANVAAGSASADFQPAAVAIARGGKIAFSFGQLTHNVAFDGVTGAPNGVGNSSNSISERTFDTAGNFAYHCTIHGAGMSGVVFVR